MIALADHPSAPEEQYLWIIRSTTGLLPGLRYRFVLRLEEGYEQAILLQTDYPQDEGPTIWVKGFRPW